MKIGIIGLPQIGKKTLFKLLTGHKPTEVEIISGKPIKAVAEIMDPRFDHLAAVYKPKKKTRARIDIELLPKLEKDTIARGDIFADIDELDAILHLVRVFEDDSVYHINGSVNPKRDIDNVNAELILHDLVFIEKRNERIEKKIKQANNESFQKEKIILARFKEHLEKNLPLRLLDISPVERKLVSSYPFVTMKRMIVALNVSESDLKSTKLLEQLKIDYNALGIDIMQVSTKVEKEIAELESEEERQEFLKDLGIEEPAINVLTRLSLKALSLISFFTVGTDEVRQWNIKAGSTTPEAAGAIHSDLQKGFIRAEVIKYEDFFSIGSEAKAKEAGKLYIKGKDYIVEDGDMLNIRFNV
jgi:hypothetical protein